MEPIRFPEVNVTYAENQPEYKPLPVFKNDSPQGEVISCWKLSWRERFETFFFGKMWASHSTFNAPLQPMSYQTRKHRALITPGKYVSLLRIGKRIDSPKGTILRKWMLGITRSTNQDPWEIIIERNRSMSIVRVWIFRLSFKSKKKKAHATN